MVSTFNGREIEQMEQFDGILHGIYADDGKEVWVMEKFGHAEAADTFSECDRTMAVYERENFDREAAIKEFIEEHTAGELYPIADYWHWYRRLTCACLYGREHFFHRKNVKFTDKRQTEWFLDTIYFEAPKPFNDCGGVFSEIRRAYGLEVTE